MKESLEGESWTHTCTQQSVEAEWSIIMKLTHCIDDSPTWLFSWLNLSGNQTQRCYDSPKLFSHLPPTPSCRVTSTKVWHVRKRLVEIRALRHFHGVCLCVHCGGGMRAEGKKAPVLLILHRVHWKIKVAVSATHQSSSDSHMLLLAPLGGLFFSSSPSAMKWCT